MAIHTPIPIFVSEVLGTAFFLTTILTTGAAIPIGFALMAAITFGNFASNCCFNPAVTTMLLLKGDISWGQFPIYIIAQLVGAVLALAWFNVRPNQGITKAV